MQYIWKQDGLTMEWMDDIWNRLADSEREGREARRQIDELRKEYFSADILDLIESREMDKYKLQQQEQGSSALDHDLSELSPQASQPVHRLPVRKASVTAGKPSVCGEFLVLLVFRNYELTPSAATVLLYRLSSRYAELQEK